MQTKYNSEKANNAKYSTTKYASYDDWPWKKGGLTLHFENDIFKGLVSGDPTNSVKELLCNH